MVDVDADQSIEPILADNMDMLLELEGDEFVRCAYLTILNRAPDYDGMTHYLQRLRAGHSKIEILRSLLRSDEARASNVQIPWITRAILRHKLKGLLFFEFASSRNLRKQREIARRLDVLEESVALLRHQSTRTEKLGELTKTLALFIKCCDQPADSELSTQNIALDLSGKSLVAKRIFRELSEALSEAQGKSI
jgi:hypothetical protein